MYPRTTRTSWVGSFRTSALVCVEAGATSQAHDAAQAHERIPEDSQTILAPSLRVRGHSSASSGNVADDVIDHYIEMQAKMEKSRDDEFSIGDSA